MVFQLISNWASLLGFILSIILLIYGITITKTIQKYELKRHMDENLSSIIERLQGCLMVISKDKIDDKELRREISALLATIENYNTLLNRGDKGVIRELRNCLKQSVIGDREINILSNSIGHFAGRFQSKGVGIDV
jgi:tRNA C32,U32 (ribose-2'-O)-methylase TrmJ